MKDSKIDGYVISITLMSNDRRGEIAYEDMIALLHKKSVIKSVGGDSQIMLRTQFRTKSKEKTVLYGKLSKFTRLDGNNWIDIQKKEIDSVEVPENKFPNLREIDYYFVPAAHRFFIPKSSKVSLSAVLKFLNQALLEVINQTEQFSVTPEQSHEAIERIFKADQVKRLEIDITYTNDDTNDEYADFVDTQLKNNGIGKAKMIFTSDSGDDIKVEGQLVKGAVELARTTGTVVAKVVENNKSDIIKTIDHPRIFEVSVSNDDSITQDIGNEILKKYREEE